MMETKKEKIEPEIYVMPSKYLIRKKEKIKLGKFLLFFLLVLGIVGLTLGGFFLYQQQVFKPKEKVEPPLPPIINIPPPEVEPFVSKEREIRQELKRDDQVLGEMKINFPEGALKEEKEIFILTFPPDLYKENDFQPLFGVYEVKPDNLEILKPVVLMVSYKDEEVLKLGKKEIDLKLAYLEEEKWKLIPSDLDLENNFLKASLDRLYSQIFSIVIEKEKIVEKPREIEREIIIETTLPSSLDSDNDGLTDEEEKIYNALIENPDTDGDSYPDGLEIENLYSPLSGPGDRLEITGLVNRYENPIFKYSILYPASFLARALDVENREVIFTAPTGEFIQIIIEDNLEKLLIKDWYLQQAPNIEIEKLRRVVINEKAEGIWSPDGLTLYMRYQGREDKIFVFTYNPGAREELSYKKTFKMMIRSFAD